MSSFKLNAEGDLDVKNNALSLTAGIDAIRQHLTVKLRIFLGEWFLDRSVGVPWYQEILVKAPLFAVVQERLKVIILETPGVLELLRFDFDFDFDSIERVFSLKSSINTSDGIIDFSQLVEV